MARLELQGICKGFDQPVIDRLDLTVEEGFRSLSWIGLDEDRIRVR